MKKRMLCLFLAVLMLATTAVIPADAAACRGAVTTSALNLRAQAGTSYSILQTIPSGKGVLVLSSEGGWCKVIYNGTEGYVSQQYLSFADTVSGSFGTGTVTGDAVRMRSGAGTSGSIITTFNKGAQMSVTGVSGNWFAVSCGGKNGYVSMDYMSVAAKAAASGTAASAGLTGRITGSSVRMRSGPGTDSDILGYYAKDVTVSVTGSVKGWYRVSSGGKEGYVSGDYLRITPDSVFSPAVDGSVNASSVNLRMGPGTQSFSVIKLLGSGTKLKLSGVSGDWYEVTADGVYGYISRQYVTLDGEAEGKASDAAEGGFTGSIIGTSVRMRSGPGTKFEVLGYYSNGVTMSILGSTEGWYKVSCNGKTGYVFGDYIRITPKTAYSPVKDGSVNANGVNFRMGPSTQSFSVIKVLGYGTKLKISGIYGDWYEVSTGDTCGYISKQFVTLGSTGGATGSKPANVPAAEQILDGTGTVTENSVRMRSGPGDSYSVVGYYNKGTQMTITGKSGSWYAVTCKGVKGYINSAYMTRTATNSRADQIVATAKQYLGVAYVWGGTSPRGFDSPGLIYYVFGQYGYTLQRTASAQYSSNGSSVSKSALQPGDLVFFSDASGAVGDVGLYIGGGQFIHASSGKGCVTINSLGSSYYSQHYIGAKRLA